MHVRLSCCGLVKVIVIILIINYYDFLIIISFPAPIIIFKNFNFSLFLRVLTFIDGAYIQVLDAFRIIKCA